MRFYLCCISLEQYAELLEEYGFEMWRDILSITEADLEQMGMLLGHRRRHQRDIRFFLAKEKERGSFTASQNQ
jgi:hypothetical protein